MPMGRLFGTDGVRGLANGELTVDLVVRLSQSAAIVLTKGRHAEELKAQGRKPRAVIARDPRISGQFLSSAVSAGLAGSGVDVWDAGVLPTPAAAFLVREGEFDFGVMVSASHNPAPDNGIKFFSYGGTKLPDEVEDRIEAAMSEPPLSPTGSGVGRITRFADAEDRYVMHLLASLDRDLSGLHIVVDCAHGAASGISPRVFADAGAHVTVIGNDPDGLNINYGNGSTHLEALQDTVLSLGADFGVAHDGDADRTLAIDNLGRVIDGDHIMAILAISLQEAGKLDKDTLVTTVMSNLGLHKAMAARGIRVIETAVGDRYVLEELAHTGASLGGEQSGHIILTEHTTTGDGILTGIQLASEVARTGKTLAELADVMDVYPQVLRNVSGVDRQRLASDEVVAAAVAHATAELGDGGRVLLRPSGTENLIRVMVEAEDQATADRLASELVAVVQERLGL
jgi:phosphoglucosamine mutase